MTIFEHELEVRFRDCDALGHVNNAVYLTYLEQARFAFWQRLTGVGGIPRSFILARVECDYRVPATAGERLIVRLRVSAVGRFELHVRVRDRQRADARGRGDGAHRPGDVRLHGWRLGSHSR